MLLVINDLDGSAFRARSRRLGVASPHVLLVLLNRCHSCVEASDCLMQGELTVERWSGTKRATKNEFQIRSLIMNTRQLDHLRLLAREFHKCVRVVRHCVVAEINVGPFALNVAIGHVHENVTVLRSRIVSTEMETTLSEEQSKCAIAHPEFTVRVVFSQQSHKVFLLFSSMQQGDWVTLEPPEPETETVIRNLAIELLSVDRFHLIVA